MDNVDRRVIGALIAHPRATNAQIAEAAHTSEATVSRRTERLLRDGTIWMTGVLDSRASATSRSLFVRLRCASGMSQRAAEQLASWPECGSVKLLSGSVDVVTEISYSSNAHLLELTQERLPSISGVLAVWHNQVIRRFSTPHSWQPPLIEPDVVSRLRAQRMDVWQENAVTHATVSELDERIAAELAVDGRLGWQELAERCGASTTTVRRRVESMMRSGVLRMRTVVEPEVIGLDVSAFVWLSVNPTHLERSGELLAQHPAMLMATATTGDRNLCGEVALDSDEALYEFISHDIGGLPGLQHADVAVSLRSLKRAGRAAAPHTDTSSPAPRSTPRSRRSTS